MTRLMLDFRAMADEIAWGGRVVGLRDRRGRRC